MDRFPRRRPRSQDVAYPFENHPPKYYQGRNYSLHSRKSNTLFRQMSSEGYFGPRER